MKKHAPLTLPARVEGGKLYLSDGSEHGEARARRVLAALLKHQPDGAYEWKLEPFAEKRRDRANRFYFGVILPLMAEESGHTVDELHELMKLRHNSTVVVDPNGEEVRIAKSTAKLTIRQFSDYLDAVILDGAEWLGISFPEPRPSEEYRDGRAA